MIPVRRKRIWNVADFALHAFGESTDATNLRARRLLRRLDAKHGGKLLVPSRGTNRGFTFAVATLARLEPDLFAPIESLEFRMEALEELAEEGLERLAADHRIIASQTAQNSRDIARLKGRVRAA